MSDRYVLAEDGKTPVPEPDLLTWARAFEKSDRIVAATDVSSDVRVSTVFLGLDHSFGHGEPLLWETMIFGGPHDGYQERYASHAEAVAGHVVAVKLAEER